VLRGQAVARRRETKRCRSGIPRGERCLRWRGAADCRRRELVQLVVSCNLAGTRRALLAGPARGGVELEARHAKQTSELLIPTPEVIKDWRSARLDCVSAWLRLRSQRALVKIQSLHAGQGEPTRVG